MGVQKAQNYVPISELSSANRVLQNLRVIRIWDNEIKVSILVVRLKIVTCSWMTDVDGHDGMLWM